jgi:hypothetical protein
MFQISKNKKTYNNKITNIKNLTKISEMRLINAIEKIKETILEEYNIESILEYKLYFNDCIDYMNGKYININKNDETHTNNKNIYIKPDGGILYIIIEGKKYPILISEIKYQGTNDIKYELNQPKQACGNAIERAAKNIRMSEMMFSNENIFPYVLFSAGCDFHTSETIHSRISSMNYGKHNYNIEINKQTSLNYIQNKLKTYINDIDIYVNNKYTFQSFIKSHKYNELKHGESLWLESEIYMVLIDIVRKSIDYYIQKIYY